MPININISDIISKLQKSQEKANQQNELRYQQGLAELTGSRDIMRSMFDQAGSLISDLGASAAGDISRGAARAESRGRQGLISAGLGNTTITGSMTRGVEEDRNRAMLALQENVSRQRAGLLTQRAGAEMGAGGGIADFIAARTDAGPDAGIYGSLIQAAAAGQQAPGPGNRITTSSWSPATRTAMSGGGGGAARGGGMSTGGTSGSYGPGAGGGGGGGAQPAAEFQAGADWQGADYREPRSIWDSGIMEGATQFTTGPAPGQIASAVADDKKKKTKSPYSGYSSWMQAVMTGGASIAQTVKKAGRNLVGAFQ